MMSVKNPCRFSLTLPDINEHLEQNHEFVFINKDGRSLKINLHDYGRLYSIEGLYENLMCDHLHCISHQKIVHMLLEELQNTGERLKDLNVLDIGAGNGLVGEVLYNSGIRNIVGIDILEEAAIAIRRDRPDVYKSFYVADLAQLEEDQERLLMESELNVLTCGSAMDFSDIPPVGFANAYNFLCKDAWFVFNIKGNQKLTTEGADPKGEISSFISYLLVTGIFVLVRSEVYQHRLSVDGRPIVYTAVLGRKIKNIPVNVLI